MRIISKFTDYYDRAVATFGRDEHFTYDRRAFPLRKKEDLTLNDSWIVYEHKGAKGSWVDFHICGELWRGFYDFGGELVDFVYDKKTKINLEKRQPLLMVERHIWNKENQYYLPLLASFNIERFVSAEEMWQKITAFLGYLKDNPPLPDNQTNIEKVVSHGFDKKRSFRPKMKK